MLVSFGLGHQKILGSYNLVNRTIFGVNLNHQEILTSLQILPKPFA